MSDKEKIYIPHQRYKGGNRDYFSHFSVTFEKAGKFIIVFVRVVLGKEAVDGFTRPQQENNVR